MKFIPKIPLFIIAISIIIIMGGIVAYGQDLQGQGLKNPVKANTFADLVQGLADAVIKVSIPLVGIFLVYAGFLFVTAGGDEKKLDTAKTTFYWSIIGAAVLLGSSVLARAIVDLVKSL